MVGINMFNKCHKEATCAVKELRQQGLYKLQNGNVTLKSQFRKLYLETRRNGCFCYASHVENS